MLWVESKKSRRHILDKRIMKDDNIIKSIGDLRDKIIDALGEELKGIILYDSAPKGNKPPEAGMNVVLFINSEMRSIARTRRLVEKITEDISLAYNMMISIDIKDYYLYEKNLKMIPETENIYQKGIPIYGQLDRQ